MSLYEIDHNATQRRLDAITTNGLRALGDCARRSEEIDKQVTQMLERQEREKQAMDERIKQAAAEPAKQAAPTRRPIAKPATLALGGEEFQEYRRDKPAQAREPVTKAEAPPETPPPAPRKTLKLGAPEDLDDDPSAAGRTGGPSVGTGATSSARPDAATTGGRPGATGGGGGQAGAAGRPATADARSGVADSGAGRFGAAGGRPDAAGSGSGGFGAGGRPGAADDGGGRVSAGGRSATTGADPGPGRFSQAGSATVAPGSGPGGPPPASAPVSWFGSGRDARESGGPDNTGPHGGPRPADAEDSKAKRKPRRPTLTEGDDDMSGRTWLR